MFREMRRSKQLLPLEECEQILRSAPRGVLSVAGEDGYPYGVPIDFVYVDGVFFFHSAREGHKLDALAACDKACLTVLDEGRLEEGSWWYHFRSVVAFGRVHPIEDEERKLYAMRAFGGKYFPTEEMLEAEIEHSGKRVLMLEMQIDHMTGKAVREN